MDKFTIFTNFLNETILYQEFLYLLTTFICNNYLISNHCQILVTEKLRKETQNMLCSLGKPHFGIPLIEITFFKNDHECTIFGSLTVFFCLLQTILEVLRYISHVPLLLPHMATKDATIQGYFIPKGSQVGTLVISSK